MRRHHGIVVCPKTSAIDMRGVIEHYMMVMRSNTKPRAID